MVAGAVFDTKPRKSRTLICPTVHAVIIREGG
jgi:hypothetical protein